MNQSYFWEFSRDRAWKRKYKWKKCGRLNGLICDDDIMILQDLIEEFGKSGTQIDFCVEEELIYKYESKVYEQNIQTVHRTLGVYRRANLRRSSENRHKL